MAHTLKYLDHCRRVVKFLTTITVELEHGNDFATFRVKTEVKRFNKIKLMWTLV